MQGPGPLFTDSKGREVVAPRFGGEPIADTHAHLDMLDDPALALARAALAGVGFIATVADVTEDAWRTYQELGSWQANAAELLGQMGSDAPVPRVRVVVGAHPHNAKDYGDDAIQELRRLAAHPLTCAIGEMGLDYHYDHSPRDVQRARFSDHLVVAHEFGLPGVVHLREAHPDGLAILREHGIPAAGCILHCFNLGEEVMEPFLELGCHVSFAGPATFKKAHDVRDAACAVPSGRILTETDCPFMAPEPFRGRTNEPALVAFTALSLANSRAEQPDEFARHTYAAAVGLLDADRAEA